MATDEGREVIGSRLLFQARRRVEKTEPSIIFERGLVQFRGWLLKITKMEESAEKRTT